MYFIDKIKEEFKNNKLIIFCDMDGVITDYNFLQSLDFKNKRPLKTNIKTINELNNLPNVELYILSICKTENDIFDKNDWLDKYASFFKRKNRFIIPKSKFVGLSSKEIKYNFLADFIKNNSDKTVILIDDDNSILKYLAKRLDNIILFQDSSIID